MIRALTSAVLWLACSGYPARADEPLSLGIFITDEERAKVQQIMANQEARIEALEKALQMAKVKSGCV